MIWYQQLKRVGTEKPERITATHAQVTACMGIPGYFTSSVLLVLFKNMQNLNSSAFYSKRDRYSLLDSSSRI